MLTKEEVTKIAKEYEVLTTEALGITLAQRVRKKDTVVVDGNKVLIAHPEYAVVLTISTEIHITE